MTHFLNRLFNIQTREWPRVLWLFTMAFIAIVGINWGKLTVQPLFWRQVGVDSLGYAFVIEGVLAIIAVAVYTLFADRVANERLLLGIALLSAAAVLGGRVVLALGYTRVGYFILYPLFTTIPLVINLQWWTYVTGFYDARAAKRIVPFLSSNARIAGAVAGLSIGFLSSFVTSDQIISFWFAAMFIFAVMIWLMPRVLRDQQTAVSSANPTPAPADEHFLGSVREGYRYVRDSTYLRWLALATFLAILLVTFLKYTSSAIIDGVFTTESEATQFLGRVEGIANLLVLPLQLVVMSRIIGRLGLGNSNLIFPVGSLLVSLLLVGGTLLVAPWLVVAGMFAYLTANVFSTALRNPTDNLLYNAVPLRVKGRARAFTNGFLMPLAALLGGLLLTWPWLRSGWGLMGLVALLPVAYVAAALGVRRHYRQALVDMLEQEDYSFLLPQVGEEFTVVDPATLQQLHQKLVESESDEFTIFMAKLISEIGGGTAVSILGDVAGSQSPRVRATILDMLTAAETRGDEARRLFTQFLQDDEAEVRRAALGGAAQVYGRDNPQFLALAAPYLADPSGVVRAAVLPPLLDAPDYREAAYREVRQMLDSGDVGARVRGLRVLGQVERMPVIAEAARFLADPADAVRLEAALLVEAATAAAKVPPDTRAELCQQMPGLLHDQIERVRQVAIRTLAHLDCPDLAQQVTVQLADSSQEVRATAVDVLVQDGKRAIPQVHALLDSPQPLRRKMATMVLSRVNPREFSPLLHTHIIANLLTIFRTHQYLRALETVAALATVEILLSALRERNQELLDEIFYLLTAVHDAAAVQVIRNALTDRVERNRINGLEALETITSAQNARLIAALSAPERKDDEIVALGRETWELEPLRPGKAMADLIANQTIDGWVRTIALYALADIAAAAMPPPKPSRPAPPPQAADKTKETPDTAASSASRRRRRRRARLENLLSELSDDEEETESAPAAGLDALYAAVSEESAEPAADPVPATPSVSPEASVETVYHPPPAVHRDFTLPLIMQILQHVNGDADDEVRAAAGFVQQRLAGKAEPEKENGMLSVIERIIFLKEVSFFKEMTIDQLKVLASVCEEEFFAEDAAIYREGEPGGVLYVVVRGRVAIERQARRKGSVVRLNTVEAHAYFGDVNLFDESPHTETAVATQDTLTLSLRREPLLALSRQYPDLSLKIINVLSQRLREASDQIARLSRSHPRALHKVFDQLE